MWDAGRSASRAEQTEEELGRCQHGPCTCVVRRGGRYCSEYCEQAALQALERDYCQCEHELTSRNAITPAHAKCL
jgi:hypothetical protein